MFFFCSSNLLLYCVLKAVHNSVTPGTSASNNLYAPGIIRMGCKSVLSRVTALSSGRITHPRLKITTVLGRLVQEHHFRPARFRGVKTEPVRRLASVGCDVLLQVFLWNAETSMTVAVYGIV